MSPRHTHYIVLQFTTVGADFLTCIIFLPFQIYFQKLFLNATAIRNLFTNLCTGADLMESKLQIQEFQSWCQDGVAEEQFECPFHHHHCRGWDFCSFSQHQLQSSWLLVCFWVETHSCLSMLPRQHPPCAKLQPMLQRGSPALKLHRPLPLVLEKHKSNESVRDFLEFLFHIFSEQNEF